MTEDFPSDVAKRPIAWGVLVASWVLMIAMLFVGDWWVIERVEPDVVLESDQRRLMGATSPLDGSDLRVWILLVLLGFGHLTSFRPGKRFTLGVALMISFCTFVSFLFYPPIPEELQITYNWPYWVHVCAIFTYWGATLHWSSLAFRNYYLEQTGKREKDYYT